MKGGRKFRIRGGDHAAQTTPKRTAASSSNSPEMGDLYSQHGPPQFSMVLSVETRNVPCAANHYLVKEPFLSAAGSRLSIPKVAETFRFRCSGLLGCDGSRPDFVWLEFLPTTGDPLRDLHNIRTFQRRIRDFGLEDIV
jgi:hypothetical protein